MSERLPVWVNHWMLVISSLTSAFQYVKNTDITNEKLTHTHMHVHTQIYVSMCTCLSTFLYTYLFIYTYPVTHLPIYLPTNLPAYLSTNFLVNPTQPLLC